MSYGEYVATRTYYEEHSDRQVAGHQAVCGTWMQSLHGLYIEAGAYGVECIIERDDRPFVVEIYVNPPARPLRDVQGNIIRWEQAGDVPDDARALVRQMRDRLIDSLQFTT